MKKLTATLCLTIAVLLGSVGMGYPALSSEMVKKKFGKITLNLPFPDNLCVMKEETLSFRHQHQAQRKMGGKLLAYWTDCESQEKMRKGIPPTFFREWVIINGVLSGDPPRERVFSRLTNEAFKKIILKNFGDIKFDTIAKDVNKGLEAANSRLLGDKDIISVKEPINLGVLAVTDTVHAGLIVNVRSGTKSIVVAVVYGMGLIRGAPVYFYFYKPYENKETIENLLQKTKFYSVKITYANP